MRRALLSVCLMVGLAPSLESAAAPPDVYFSVAYRQKEGPKLSQSVHVVNFSCDRGHCDMIVLTLNQCAGGDQFYPQIEHASTRNGDLTVKVEAPGVLVADWSLPTEGATLTHRFEYESVTPVIGKTARHGLTYLKLTGFSGAAVKFSDALGKVLAWTFEPLRGRNHTIRLDCAVLLDGID